MVRQAFASFLVVTLLAPAPARAAAQKSTAPATATSTRVMLFNLTPAGSYQVRRNGSSNGAAVASPTGGVVFDTNANPGDRYEFLLTGLDPVSPARPTGFTATGNSSGCVVVRWNPPASTDYVSDYSLLWGKSAGAYTDSLRIDGVDISKGTAWLSTQCGFLSGAHVFALRAHNAFDRWSAPSAPSSTTIGNEDTHGPLPPTNVRVTESTPGCVTLTWSRSSDATVTGYRVFFGTRSRTQAPYTDSIEAGNETSAVRCGLAEGSYYFAVRAYTALGVMSTFSAEVAIGGALPAAEKTGVIVPDGFWASDPSRPLEIRNLPRNWCVRIFDTAGGAVRRHENAFDGATWTWNFHNDNGQRVAPALYLVRVTDAGGTVKRSGRFLVQSLQ